MVNSESGSVNYVNVASGGAITITPPTPKVSTSPSVATSAAALPATPPADSAQILMQNIGSGVGVYQGKSYDNTTFLLRSLVGQGNVTITSDDSTVYISATSSGGGGTSNSNSLPLTGGTLTGPLILSADPSTGLGAATKQYVDAKAFLPLTGGTLTGSLLLSADPSANLGAATKQYVDTKAQGFLPLVGGTLTGNLILASNPSTNLGAATKQYVDSADQTKLSVTGGTLTGTLVLAADPTNNLEAATKHYVDVKALLLTGGTLTGTLVLAADPANNLEAATKHYVDTKVATVSGGGGGGSLTFPLLIPDGTHAAPSIALTSNAMVGIYTETNAQSIPTLTGIANGGTGYSANQVFGDNAGNNYIATAVDGNGTITALQLTKALICIGPPPTNPINLSGGFGTGAQANLTYTQIRNLSFSAGSNGELSFNQFNALIVDDTDVPTTNKILSSSLIVGPENSVDDTSQYSAVFGPGNTIQTGQSNLVTGSYHTVYSLNSFVAGSGNSILDSTSSLCFMYGNNNSIFSAAPSSFMFGNGNTFGSNSTLSAAFGNYNTFSNSSNSLTVGTDNTLDGNENFVFGDNLAANGTYSLMVGSNSTSSSGAQMSIMLGSFNTIASPGKTNILAGNNGNIYGNSTFSFGDQISDNGNSGAFILGAVNNTGAGFASYGSKQREEYVFYGTGTAAATRLTTDGNSASTVNVAALADKSAAMFSIKFIAIDNTTYDVVTFYMQYGLIKRATGAASVTMSSGNTAFVQGPSASGQTPTLPSVTADTTHGGFNITWTPPGTHAWSIGAQLVLIKIAVQ